MTDVPTSDDGTLLDAPIEPGPLTKAPGTSYADERSARQRAERLYALTAALARAQTREAAVQTILSQVAEGIGAIAGAVFERAHDSPEFVLLGSTGYRNEVAQDFARRVAGEPTAARDAVQLGTPIFIGSPEEWQARGYIDAAPVEASSALAWVALPLQVDGRILGVLTLTWSARRNFNDDDRAFMIACAGQCAMALERVRLFEAERRARGDTERISAWTARLHALSARLAAAVTPRDVSTVVLEEACLAFGAERASMMIVGEDGDSARMLAAIGYSREQLVDYQSYSLRAVGTPTVEVVRSGEPLFLESRELVRDRYAASFIKTLEANAVVALAILPVVYGGIVHGVFGLAWNEPRAFSTEERGLMQTFASQCGQALQRATLFAEERESRHRIARLQQVTADFAAALTPEAIGDIVVNAGVRNFGAARASIARLTADEREFELVAHLNLDAEQVEQWRRFPNAPGLPFADVVAAGEPVFLTSRADAVARYPSLRDELVKRDVQASAVLPLVLAGRVSGGIAFSFTKPRPFPTDERTDLMTLARQAAQAMERSRLYAAEHAARARAEDAADRTARLQHVTAALAAATSPEDVASAMLDHGLPAVGAIAGVVCRLTADANAIEHVWALGYPVEGLESFRQTALTLPLPPRDVVRTRSPVFIESSAQWLERYLPPPAGMETAPAAAALPLLVGERLVGVMVLRFPHPRSFSADDRTQILNVASQCAQAMERARLHQAERVAREDAEEANRAKSEFLAIMSHELRTPLNAIAGHVQLLEMGIHGALTEQQRDALSRVSRAQDRLLGLINDVLNFARLEAGRVEYELQPSNVSEAVNEIVGLMAPQLVTKMLTSDVQVEDASFQVMADREKLAQILLNLLSNAVKFTPAGGRITIGIARDPRDQRVALIRVADTGVGIPVEKLQTIFEPFVQLGRGIKHAQDGSGLGLAISRELARGMGGELIAESTLGEGSVFTLILPVFRET